MAYKIAVIPGDGVGPEVISEGRKVLDAVSEVENFEIEWWEFPHGAEHYLKTGELLGEETLKEIERCDAIYFGSIGDPRVPTGVLEQGILLTLRFYFDQFVNLRPVKLFEGVPTPLAGKRPEDIDFCVVRENTEDFYVGAGGRVKLANASKQRAERGAAKGKGVERQVLEIKRSLYQLKFGLEIEGDADEIAYQIGVLSRKGCERVIRFAFEFARARRGGESAGRKKVTSVDKANVLTHAYGFWREIFSEIAKEYPEIETEFAFVDAVAMWFVKNPENFDVVVTPNMFGDILTDLGAMIQGGLGLAPGANINPEGVSMFEPIHGSAPKYAGKGIANPIATIWAGSLMLEYLGERRAAEIVLKAISEVLRERKVLTPDLGGSSKTSDVGDEIVKKVKSS
ncbi:MAG: isocitrate/isopropylmalate dehydrogenase family protein [Candidatus Methanospirare jalkutatii]|nr:MAG: isocitrate/isopropylmalate dehydrogenase family protein [Candidatus Methanospirare jalkutatii]UYZ40787.1 MAG: isocitrate/isopropylmalate dehydrogenase family protein [Candidatus Methanospirare jalkutatii]